MSQANNGRALGVAVSKPTLEGMTVGGNSLGATGAATINIGTQATDVIGFYGVTPVVQRASSVQASSNLASSTAFGTTQLAWAVEVTDTLVGLGVWKGSA